MAKGERRNKLSQAGSGRWQRREKERDREKIDIMIITYGWWEVGE